MSQIHAPKGWKIVSFEDIAMKAKYSIKRGPWGSSIKKSFFVPEGYKVYQQHNVIYDDFEYGDYYIDEEKFNELKEFEIKPGDFLISCSGTIGKVARMPQNSKKGVMNQALLKISIDGSKVVSDFFLYLLNSPVLQNKLLIKGSAMKNITSVTDIKKIQFSIPEKKDLQKKIVQKLDYILGQLEEKKKVIFDFNQIESYKKLKENMGNSLLSAALNGKVTEDWRKDNPKIISALDHLFDYQKQLNEKFKVKVRDANKKNRKKPKRPENLLSDFKVCKEGKQKNWAKIPFVNLCVLQRGFDLPKQSRIRGKYPIVSSGGITDFHKEFKIKGPGVVTGRSGSVGSTTFVNENFWPLNTSLYVKDFNGNLPKFVYYFLRNFDFKKFSSHTAVPTLNRNIFFDEQVDIPPLEEQKIIVKNLEAKSEEIKKMELLLINLINKRQKMINSLKKLPFHILDKAFSGKLVN